MGAEEMLKEVQKLKEECLLNNFRLTPEIMLFFTINWMQVLDILDDALYEYLNKGA